MNHQEVILTADEQYIPARKLQAGALTLLYEEGRVRYITYKDQELVRLIYPAVRDGNWSTIPFTIEDEKIQEDANGFRITYTGVHDQGGIQYKASYTIEGKDNVVRVSMKGTSFSSFQSRRIGLCVLHPVVKDPSVIQIIEPDGSTYEGRFPELVNPHQPFLEVQGMQWNASDHAKIKIDFEGEIFESEDQRNWGDFSYKTYSTPQRLPAPVQINPGDKKEHIITISVDTSGSTDIAAAAADHEEVKIPFPKIGYSKGTQQQALTEAQIDLLQKIPFDHYRIELHVKDNSWKDIFYASEQEARLLNTRLELVVFFNTLSEPEVQQFVDGVGKKKALINSMLLLSENDEIVPADFFSKAAAICRKMLPAVEIGYGTNAYFVDINRNRPDHLQYDFTSFYFQPQVHVSDSRSIIENTGSGTDMIHSLEKITGNKPVHISPVTFCDRGKTDQRFHTSFGAWWTLLLLRNMSEARSLSFFELTGDAGLIASSGVTPVYKVLEKIKAFSPIYVIRSKDTRIPLNQEIRVVLENQRGERLIFRSNFPDLTATQ